METTTAPHRVGSCVLALAATTLTVLCALPARADGLTAAPGLAAQAASFDARAAAASAAHEAGRLDDAERLYAALVNERPAWIEGHWYLGSIAYERQQHREARAAFARVLRLEPTHAGALAMSGLCAFELGQHAEALRELLRAMQLNVAQSPEIARVVRYHAGILFTRFGEFEAGNKLLTSVAVDADASSSLIEAFGLNLLRRPVLPAELGDAERPRVELAGRAGYAMARRDAAEAEARLRELQHRFGDTSEVQYLWGVFLAASDPAQAMAAWRAELERTPGHVPARLQLATVLAREGRTDEALSHAQEAVRLAPRQFAPALSLGSVQLQRGDLPAAIEALEAARQLGPESAQVHYVLSVAYARAGRADEAERARTEFRRLSERPDGGAGHEATTPSSRPPR